MDYDYEKLGLKMGLEIHQQLNSQHKLFCPCKTELVDDDFDELVQRKLRPTQSELGETDRAALQEVSTHVVALSRAEDLPAHGDAVSIRFAD